MKRLVFFPSEGLEEYIKKGKSLDDLYDYYNPGGYFDEIICLSPWGKEKKEKVGKINCIKANPVHYREIIQEINPVVVRGYGGYRCSDWISFNKVENIPTVLSVHDTNPKLLFSSIKYADHVICMTEVVKDAVIKKTRLDESRISVMPNRINHKVFHRIDVCPEFEKLKEQFGYGKHILHVGRRTEQKNLDTLIKALKILGDEYSVIAVGRGDVSFYKELARQEGVSERCHFIDSIPNTKLPIYYSWCDCMCTPSRWEGFGVIFIEAAACETAIVTSDIRPMNEYLVNEKNAILCKEYENPCALANAIRKATDGSSKMEQMKKEAGYLSMEFSKERIDDMECQIYDRVISEGPRNEINKNCMIKIKNEIKYRVR